MAYKLQLKRGASGSLPTGSAGEPLFTTDTNDLYIGTGSGNQRYQKYIASGTSSQFLKGDGSLDSNTYYLASNPSSYIALTALTASSPLLYNNTTGVFSIQLGTDSQNGYLSSSDRTTFNNKQDQFTVSSPLSFSGLNITISQASGSVNGFLSSTDWTTFNNKQNTITNPVTGTGTTNYLPKWTSGSAIGNSVIQESSSSIGIGVSPIAKFQVKDNVSGFIFQEFTNGAAIFLDGANGDFVGGNYFHIIADGSSYLGLGGYGGGATPVNISSSGNLLLNSTTDNGNRLQVTGNGYFSGNVGVGTSSPATKLHIANSSSAVLISESGSAATIIGTNAAGNTSQELFLRGFPLTFTGNGGAGAVQMTLNSSGNLGLGVTPSAWSSLWSVQQFGQAGSLFAFKSGSNYTVISNNSYAVGGSFQVGDARYINNGFSTAYAQNNSGEHLWLTAPSGTAGGTITHTQAMTLTANGRLLLGTNTEGTYLLDVYGTGRFSGDIRVNNTITAEQSTAETPAIVATSGWSGTINNPIIKFGRLALAVAGEIGYDDPNTGLYIGTTTNHRLAIRTNNSDRLTITSTGAATFSSSVTVTDLRFADTAFITSDSDNAGSNPIVFRNGAAGGELMRITSGGNLLVNSTTDNGNRLQITGDSYINGIVRIGTTGTYPATKLFVSGASANAGIVSEDTVGTGSFIRILGDATSGNLINYTSGTSLRFATSDASFGSFAERMRLDSSGNLGLGVTPSAWSLGKAFEINSAGNNIWSYSNDNIYLNQNSYFNSGWKYGTSATAAQYILFQGSHLWQIAPSGTAGNAITFTQAMTLTANGRLLLGTNTEGSELLQVNGSALISGNLVVGSGGASDRVIYINSQNGSQSEIRSNAGAGFGYNGIMISSNQNGANSLPSWSLDLGGARNSTDVIDAFVVGRKPNGGSWSNFLQISSTGAATFSSTLGINGVADSVKSGTYTPTLAAVYNVASFTAYELQYMRVGNVVTVSGYIQATATAANTWTRISITLPISSTFDFSYRAGGGGGASATNNVCAIQAGAFGTSVVYLDSYPNTTSNLGYTFSFTYLIM